MNAVEQPDLTRDEMAAVAALLDSHLKFMIPDEGREHPMVVNGQSARDKLFRFLGGDR